MKDRCVAPLHIIVCPSGSLDSSSDHSVALLAEGKLVEWDFDYYQPTTVDLPGKIVAFAASPTGGVAAVGPYPQE